jgi:hypothetical protein
LTEHFGKALIRAGVGGPQVAHCLAPHIAGDSSFIIQRALFRSGAGKSFRYGSGKKHVFARYSATGSGAKQMDRQVAS